MYTCSCGLKLLQFFSCFCSIRINPVHVKMDPDSVKRLLLSGKTYKEIGEYLAQQNPGNPRGLSARSVRRFVSNNGLKDSVHQEMKSTVAEAVSQVF